MKNGIDMKRLKSKVYLTCVTLMNVGFFACCDYEPGGTCQFTPNELSHLYINVSSLVYDGHTIGYRDTIAYLLNGTDTISSIVHTHINGGTVPYDPSIITLYGTSHYEFDDSTGFKWASVSVFKEFPGSNAQISAEISLVSRSALINMNVPIDTAKILGKIYNNVYKFDFPVNSSKIFKCIYFAKKIGFIKIEAADGRKLERLQI